MNYRIIEEVTDPNRASYGKTMVIYETTDRAEALHGCQTWRRLSAPGFAHYVLDEHDQPVE